MLLFYTKKNQKRKTDANNEDVGIEVKQSDHRTTIFVTAKEDIELQKAFLPLPQRVNFQDHYFLNGYQSWTDTKEFKLSKRLRNIKKSPHIISHMFAMDKYGDATFYNYRIRKSHGYDVFYSKGKQNSFVYNVNHETAYLIFELTKDTRRFQMISDVNGLRLKKGEKACVFDFKYFDSFEEGLAEFHKDFTITEREKIFGYTSWYNYYQDISEQIILRDLEALDSRFNLFQIDDGYETFVGDWLDVDEKKFPNGLKCIVDKAHEKGYKAGIWLAPFSAEEKSKLVREHPEYLRKDKNGKPVKAGGNWSGFYALDLENKEAMAYVKECLRHYADMGFDFFKLDFLYSAALPRYEGKTRAEVQNMAYRYLRNILGDKMILGCGANIMSSYRAFDYLRVGTDVSLSFNDSAVMQLFHRERPSTKHTIQNTIYRSIFDGHLFLNDPDVFLLRDDNISLTKEQRHALSTINALFGSVLMTSDNIAEYDEEKKQALSVLLDLFENAKVDSYATEGRLIKIHYTNHGQAHELAYDTAKGVLTNER